MPFLKLPMMANTSFPEKLNSVPFQRHRVIKTLCRIPQVDRCNVFYAVRKWNAAGALGICWSLQVRWTEQWVPVAGPERLMSWNPLYVCRRDGAALRLLLCVLPPVSKLQMGVWYLRIPLRPVAERVGKAAVLDSDNGDSSSAFVLARKEYLLCSLC